MGNSSPSSLNARQVTGSSLPELSQTVWGCCGPSGMEFFGEREDIPAVISGFGNAFYRSGIKAFFLFKGNLFGIEAHQRVGEIESYQCSVFRIDSEFCHGRIHVVGNHMEETAVEVVPFQ